jgi:hypothetical protein
MSIGISGKSKIKPSLMTEADDEHIDRRGQRSSSLGGEGECAFFFEEW